MRRLAWGVMLGAIAAGCAERERSRLSEGQLVASELDFGTVAVHKARELEVTLQDVGRGNVTVLEVSTLGPADTYRAAILEGAPRRLSTGGQCTVRVRFTPRSEGEQPGVLLVHTEGSEERTLRVAISGQGLEARATVEPERLDFGRIEVESSKVLGLSLKNSSPLEVEVTPTATGADRDELELSSGPLTLAPGEERAVQVAFRPMRVGPKLLGVTVTPCQGCADQLVPVAALALEQAVVAEPPAVDFGQVPVDRERQETVVLHNLSTEPMWVSGVSLSASMDPSFRVRAAFLPATLLPETRETFEVFYSPGHMGLAEGEIHFQVASRRHPTTDLPLRAFGGSSELCVAPPSQDFGVRPVGSKTSAVVTVTNCGASNAAPLAIASLEVVADPSASGEDQFALEPISLPAVLVAGAQLQVKLFFEPVRAGPAAASVRVRSDAYAAGLWKVPVRGEGRALPPCRVAITPPLVDFGTVRPKHKAVLGVKVENLGADLCPVKNVRLFDDAVGAFTLPGGGIDGLLLPAGSSFAFMVGFTAGTAEAGYLGAVSLEVGDPANPRRLVPLEGNTQVSCVVASPRFLDFGTVRPDCPPPPLDLRVENVCGAPATVLRAFVGPGTTDGQFALASTSTTLPTVLEQAQSFSLGVSYSGLAIGTNLSPLFVDVLGLRAPLLVPLLGESSAKAERQDVFVQQDGSKVDVLFVVDNTASMVEEQPRLHRALPAFVSAAMAKQVDLHLGVTTTGIEPATGACPGGAMGGEAGRLFPADSSLPRILTSATPDLPQALVRNAEVGQCAFIEKGLEAMRRALSSPLVDRTDDSRTSLPDDGNLGFLRAEAALSVVVVGDEDDHSADTVDTYLRFLQQLKGIGQPGRAMVHAIAPVGKGCDSAGGTGTRYAEAAQRTGGEAMSICAPDYAPLLQAVAERSFSPQDRFPLSARPEPSTLVVTIDGVPTQGYRYDAAANQIVFDLRPAAGARVTARYRMICP